MSTLIEEPEVQSTAVLDEAPEVIREYRNPEQSPARRAHKPVPAASGPELYWRPSSGESAAHFFLRRMGGSLLRLARSQVSRLPAWTSFRPQRSRKP